MHKELFSSLDKTKGTGINMNMIACVDSHWGIGNKGKLLVDIPADKKLFKELTIGGVVLGGRITMEGLPGGVALKERTNIVLTGKEGYSFGDAVIVYSVEEAIEELSHYPDDRIYIIGGGRVYQSFLPYCDKAFVTKVNYRYEADTFFPNLDRDGQWMLARTSEEQTYYGLKYYFTVYKRRE